MLTRLLTLLPLVLVLAVPLPPLAWPLLLLPLALHLHLHLPPPLHLRGRTVLITGCDSGYGHSLALHCSSLGMRVIATCLSRYATLCYYFFIPSMKHDNLVLTRSEGCRRLEESEGVTVVMLDITSTTSREAMVEQIAPMLRQTGLDCLVNNAAVLVFGESTWQTEEMVKAQVMVNMVGPLLLTRALLPHLARCKGRVINMISNCTSLPLPTLAVYTGSKAGLLALSTAMRPEVARYQVTLVIVNPGDAPFTTSLTAGQGSHFSSMAANMTAEEKQLYRSTFPACRNKFTSLNASPTLERIPASTNFYKVMESAIGSKNPFMMYDNSTAINRLVFAFIRLLPDWLSDKAKMNLTYPTMEENDTTITSWKNKLTSIYQHVVSKW